METTALNCRNNCAGRNRGGGFRGGRSSCRFELRHDLVVFSLSRLARASSRSLPHERKQTIECQTLLLITNKGSRLSVDSSDSSHLARIHLSRLALRCSLSLFFSLAISFDGKTCAFASSFREAGRRSSNSRSPFHTALPNKEFIY